jgi:hypothetical protein
MCVMHLNMSLSIYLCVFVDTNCNAFFFSVVLI